MKIRLFTDESMDPLCEIEGNFDGADDGRTVIMHEGKPFLYEDSTGTVIDFRMAETILDTTGVTVDDGKRAEPTIG